MLPTKVFEFPANFFCKRIIETILLIFSRHNMKIENYNYVLPIYIVASISRKKNIFYYSKLYLFLFRKRFGLDADGSDWSHQIFSKSQQSP